MKVVVVLFCHVGWQAFDGAGKFEQQISQRPLLILVLGQHKRNFDLSTLGQRLSAINYDYTILHVTAKSHDFSSEWERTVSFAAVAVLQLGPCIVPHLVDTVGAPEDNHPSTVHPRAQL
jgi:hypothetical protein